MTRILLFLFSITGFVVADPVAENTKFSTLANEGTFPFHVSVFFFTTIRHCSGAIIGKSSVITAANCIIQSNGKMPNHPLIVRTGICGSYSNDSKYNYHQVKKVFIPEKFNRSDPHSDGNIAVLLLDKPMLMTPNINKIPLATSKDLSPKVTKIAGYYSYRYVSRPTEMGVPQDNKLRFEDVRIVPYKNCQKLLAKKPYEFKITNEQFCTMYHSQKVGVARVGDLGSPVVENHKLVGVLGVVAPVITAYYHKPRQLAVAVFTNVGFYHDFIKNAKKDIKHQNAHSFQYKRHGLHDIWF